MGCFSAPSQKSESKTGSQKDLLKKLIDKFTPEIDKGPDVFQGDQVAGLSGLQETGISGASAVGGTFTSPQSSAGFTGGPLAGETTNAVSDLLTGQTGASPISSGQFAESFKSTTSDPARKTFREETNPAINEAFAGPGFFSSARSKEIVKQKTDLEDRLTSSLSAGQFANTTRNQQIEEAKAGRTQAAVGQAIQVGEAEAKTIRDNISIAASQVQGLKELIGIGSVEQTQEQREIFAEIEKFAQENQLLDPDDLSVLMALLGQNFSSGSRSGGGLGSSLLTSAGSEAGTALGGKAASVLIASDIAVKENIEVVPNALDKIKQLKACVYNYKDEPGIRRIGLIAQDVEKVMPEAVVDVDGIKHVDTYALQALIISGINELIGAN